MLYLSQSVGSCYGDEDVVEPVGEPAAVVGVEPVKFTQDDVNKVVQARVKKMQEALQKTESDYKQLLASKNITDQERATLEANLTAVQGS